MKDIINLLSSNSKLYPNNKIIYLLSSSYADLFTPTFCIVTMRQDYNFKMIQLCHKIDVRKYSVMKHQRIQRSIKIQSI